MFRKRVEKPKKTTDSSKVVVLDAAIETGVAARPMPGIANRWFVNGDQLPWTKSKIAYYSQTEKLYRCIDCNCLNNHTELMAQHWIERHGDLIVFHCHLCGLSSNFLFVIKMHILEDHRGVINQQFFRINSFWNQLINYLNDVPRYSATYSQ